MFWADHWTEDPMPIPATTPGCTCYVDNCRTHIDRLRQRRDLTAVVECPKHSTPELQALQRRGREAVVLRTHDYQEPS